MTRADGIVELEEQLAFPRTRTVVTRIVRDAPQKIPLLVADALVALRAALEHALYAEITHREGPLGEKAARLVEIPACRTLGRATSGAGSPAGRRTVPLHCAWAVSWSGGSRVCSPDHAKDAENHPLARLVLHTNHAKHRNPAVTAVRIAAMYDEDAARPAPSATCQPRPEEPVRVGGSSSPKPRSGRRWWSRCSRRSASIGTGTDRWPISDDRARRDLWLGPGSGSCRG